MSASYLQEILHDATDPARLIPAVSSGFVIALLSVIIELSFASLIFSGPLAPFAPSAAGLTLFGGFVVCLVVALFSGHRTSVALPQDVSAAVMASVSATIVAATDPSLPQQGRVTVAAAMALSTLATALLFLVMGRFRLGNLMRYMPYPVVGGFMAGIGWLLIQGSVSITTGVSLSFEGLPQLLAPDKLLLLLPAVLLTLTLLLALSRWASPFAMPATLGLAICCFAVYLGITGQGLKQAGDSGLLLGGMPEGSMLWPVFTLADLAHIRFDALLGVAPQLLTIPLVAAISLLLIASGLETATRKDMDLTRELYVNAAANFLGGAGGAHAGYTALSLSLLGPKTGSDSRLTGLACALFIGAATFLGSSFLGYFPRFILGGLVLFLGVATLLDWAVAVRRQVSRVDYALILSILCAIGFFGFLQGVGYGLFMATVIFVIKYSRLPVVSQETDASRLSSARTRSVPDRHILRDKGRSVRVVRVTGYLFFGSASELSRTVGAHLQPGSADVPTHLILDFAEVDGFDSSAVNSFLRLLQRASAAGCRVALCSAPDGLEAQLRLASPAEADAARYLPDLDRALEWCEDEVLARASAQHAGEALDTLFDRSVDDLMDHLEAGERFEALLERLQPHLQRRTFRQGEVILAANEPAPGVWLLVSGHAEELCRTLDGTTQRLRSLGPGDAAGCSHPGRAPDPATELVAVEDSELALLEAATLRALESSSPQDALAFYTLFAQQLEARAGDLR